MKEELVMAIERNESKSRELVIERETGHWD